MCPLALPYPRPSSRAPILPTPFMRQFLLKANWTPDERYPKLQYKDASGTLMMLPSDLVLIQVCVGREGGQGEGGVQVCSGGTRTRPAPS